ncbi:DEAD/DEAH box helicase [Archangium violaceum]|uniref:DEAD/DEAH box helicase n=1 Tax=Archangium violaceum Cb vi76 TaxID=1406225 RepID=A0A084SMB6_9BACT|nr:DEAD/DEAH box helicase [Archangium violaceum]KFA89601.1 DEAD/DEAH box helicase [Archangium violaceum Cb vi76]
MAPQIALDFVTSSQKPVHPALEPFHPVVQRWFTERLGEPSRPQVEGWPLIQAQQDVLIAAPTGSGKTLTAFLAALDRLFRLALEGRLEDRTQVLYVSPLKALGNDVQKNLLQPLEELVQRARAAGFSPQELRVQVRTGDTSASERAQMVRRPPHILITTPESIYLYLTADRARATLRSVRTVIVDEIHALARDKRGSHFALSLERLKALTEVRPQLIGLSATQKPLEAIAGFLTGERAEECRLVQVGHQRPWDLRVEIPDAELGSLATNEMWGQVYDRLVQLSGEHRTTLVFVNTRKMAERVAHDLGERLGEDKVAAHHGSMSREMRLSAEERLKAGQLSVMVATASLELGIDVGNVDLVVQLGTTRSISVLLQRVGRAGHYKGGISKGILIAMTRDELMECVGLLNAVREGDLDAVRIPEKPLDVLAQQVVAACACEEWDERALYSLLRRAYPYRHLTYEEYEKVLETLSEGVSLRRGRAGVHLHRDRVNQRLKARRGVRITALTNGGAIPDTFTFNVVAEPEGKVVGTLDEDFAVESTPGDIFLLGTTAWRIQRVMGASVMVENAHGQPPTVPFWRGEAPGRTDELSVHVGRLREELTARKDAALFLEKELRVPPPAVDALLAYLRAGQQVLGAVPSHTTIVAERFFDEAGGMQLILHAPFGSRVNRAWGLALRKRFCRTFDFELQAAATEDGLLLSLGEQHSFPLEDIFQFLNPENVEEVLVQAVLQVPLFGTRFRWNATRALSLSRFSGGKRVAPNLQRARSEDLLAAVFPAQVGCQDNHGGADVELPDHPLVKQTMEDCLREAMDIEGLREVLRRMKDGRIKLVAKDVPEPSLFAHQMVNSQPYTFLDDAPAEERRVRNVVLRRTLPAEDAASFGALDADAIDQVVRDAAPPMRDEDELHDALLQLVLLPENEVPGRFVSSLLAQRRVAWLEVGGRRFLVPAERQSAIRALFPEVPLQPELQPLPGDKPVEREAAVQQVVRGWMELLGPTTAGELAEQTALDESEVFLSLHQLEATGGILRGRFRPFIPHHQEQQSQSQSGPHLRTQPLSPRERDGVRVSETPGSTPAVVEWCDRRLLQRIHRLTVGRLRKEIEPLSAQDFMRFLFRWHHLEELDALRGSTGLSKAITLLQGYEAPASAWERYLLPARMKGYLGDLLERACYSGEVAWGRLTQKDAKPVPGPRRGAPATPPEPEPTRSRAATPNRNASLTFVRREDLDWMLSAARPNAVLSDGGVWVPPDLSGPAKDVVAVLEQRGACFFNDLCSRSRRLPAEVEDALWELVARGLVTADAVQNLRVLQSPAQRKRQKLLQRGGPGRWSLLVPSEPKAEDEVRESLARLFLQRYGIVWRDLVMRESLTPSWRELLYVYRRMEARGEIRGGRFVAGFVGEQFALPEAVDVARAVRRQAPSGVRVQLSAVDPLNLTGVVTPGPRVPATVSNVVTYVDGVPQGFDAQGDDEDTEEESGPGETAQAN